MKKILLGLFILFGLSVSGQVLQAPNVYGYQFRRVGGDTLLFIPGDTLQVPATYNSKTFIARKGTSLYFWNGQKWGGFGSGTVKNIGISVPSAFSVTGSPVTDSGVITISGAGTAAQYITGAGTLALVTPTVPVRSIKQGGALSLTGLTKLSAFGASWELGSVSLDPTKRYMKRASDSLGLTIDNACGNGNGYLANTDTLFARGVLNGSRDNLIVMGSAPLLADVISVEDKPHARFRYKEFARTFLANCWMKSVQPFRGNGTAVSGTWTAQRITTAVNRSLRMNDSVLTGTGHGSLYRINVTIAEGESIVIGYLRGLPGGGVGSFQVWPQFGSLNAIVYGDSPTPYATPGVNHGGAVFRSTGEVGTTLFPGTLVMRGYAAGTYTVDIVVIGTGTIYLDYWGVMAAPQNAKPVVVLGAAKIPEMNWIQAFPGLRYDMNRYTNIANTIVREVIQDHFGDYPVSFVLPEHYLVPDRDLRHNDNLHPNLSGDSVLALAVLDGVRYKSLQLPPYNTGYQVEPWSGMSPGTDTADRVRYNWGGELRQNTNIYGNFDVGFTNRAVGIGTGSPNSAAILDISSTTKGVTFPRMTSAQRTAISAPITGLMVYDTDSSAVMIYSGSSWGRIGGAAAASGITSLNGQTGSTQTFTGGRGITISSSSNVHNFSLINDTLTLAVFGGGSGAVADSSVFSTDALYGSLYLDVDTFFVTKIVGNISSGATDTLGIQLYFNDSLNTGTAAIASSTIALTSRPQGHSTTTFSTSTIPPGNFIWAKSPTVIAGRKPEYLSVSLIGYRKRRS